MMKYKLEMVTVPKGWFLMGADPTVDGEADSEEQPQRRVWLDTYEIQKTSVTVGLWQEFLRETRYDWSFHDKVEKVSPEAIYPITYVSWFDCCKFTEWLGSLIGGTYALPTEAQWEKACRGQHGQLYPWGNEAPKWIDEAPQYYEANRPVGFRPSRQSPCGCLDMYENVSEWCSDWYDDEYDTDNPDDTVNPTGPVIGKYKVFRGGSPLDSGWPRCSSRGFNWPHFRHERFGFRVVLNL